MLELVPRPTLKDEVRWLKEDEDVNREIRTSNLKNIQKLFYRRIPNKEEEEQKEKKEEEKEEEEEDEK